MKMEEKPDMMLRPERIQIGRSSIQIMDPAAGRHKIPYKEIISACISVKDQGSGIYHEPEITDICESMEGDLILYDRRHRRWRILTDLAEQTAGSIVIQLAVRAPYILLGAQPWIDMEDDEAYAEMITMVETMRHK